MGHRNPFRISVDKKTGFVYWGEVGPDANDPDSAKRACRHRMKLARQEKQAIMDGLILWVITKPITFDFAANKSGEKFDRRKTSQQFSQQYRSYRNYPRHKKHLSGIHMGNQKNFLWWEQVVGMQWRAVFYADDFKNAAGLFLNITMENYLIYEWMRGWIMAVTLDKDGNYVSMERFMPSYKFSNPMDMEFAD